MTRGRFDPFRELEEASMRLGARFGRPGDVENLGDWAPAVDVQETETEYVVKVDLPAVTREQVRVGVEDGVLTVEGERRQEPAHPTVRYHRLERAYGPFVRRLALPSEVDEDRITATFKDGVLTVHLPKATSRRAKAVTVSVD